MKILLSTIFITCLIALSVSSASGLGACKAKSFDDVTCSILNE